MSISRSHLITLLIFPFLFTTALSFCANSYKISLSTCIFYYSYSDPNCTQFSFEDCTWEECVDYETVNNVTSCVKYETFSNSDWNFCTNECCSTSNNYPVEYASLDQCNEDHKNVVIMIIIIVCSVVGGLIVIALLICLFRWLIANMSCRGLDVCCSNVAACFVEIVTCKCLKKLKRSPPPATEKLMVNVNLTTEMTQIVSWSYPKSLQYDNEVCSQCSEQGFAVKYACGHKFHKECLKNSLVDKKCPVCRYNLTDNIKIICGRCFEGQFMIQAASLTDEIMSQTCQRCINRSIETPS